MGEVSTKWFLSSFQCGWTRGDLVCDVSGIRSEDLALPSWHLEFAMWSPPPFPQL